MAFELDLHHGGFPPWYTEASPSCVACCVTDLAFGSKEKKKVSGLHAVLPKLAVSMAFRVGSKHTSTILGNQTGWSQQPG